MPHPNHRKRNIIISLILLLILLMVLAWVIWFQPQDQKTFSDNNRQPIQQSQILTSAPVDQVVAYFLTTDKKNLVPLTFKINATQEAAWVAVEKILAGAPNEFVVSPIPEGTKLLDLYSAEETIYVNLNEAVLNITDTNQAKAVMDTLAATIQKIAKQPIKLLVNGELLQDLGGVDVSKPYSVDVINYYGKNANKTDECRAIIYFSDKMAMYLVPVTLPVNENIKALSTIKALVSGPPKESGLSGTVWSGTKVRGVEIVGDVMVINLSKEALNYGGGSAFEMAFVNSLYYTATALEGINSIELIFDGEPVSLLPEGTEVSGTIIISTPLNAIN